MLLNPKLPGALPPGPPTGDSEHPLDPKSNTRPLRKRDQIPHEVGNSIFNKNGLWAKCLAASLTLSQYIFNKFFKNF